MMESVSRSSLMLPELDLVESHSFIARKLCIGCGDWPDTEPHRSCCNSASKITHLSQSPYFTRSSARSSERLNTSSFLSNSNQNHIVRRCVTPLSSRNSNPYAFVENSNQNLECISGVPFTSNSIENRRELYVDLSRSRIDNGLGLGNSELVPFEQSYVTMDFPDHRPESCCSCRRWCLFFLLLVVLLPTAWYIHKHFAETRLFFNKVEIELCRLQEQMERMKHNVEKGTKQQLETMGKDTKQKLEAVENLLREIKSTQDGGGETFSCSDSGSVDKNTQNDAIRVLVLQVLDEYDADKTGKTDFALESSGGSIVSTGNTQPYEPESTTASLFGIPICCSANGPRAVIQANVHPGECWAFTGSSGSVVIKLLGYVYVSSVSLEHISKSISPSGEIDSAPKEFSIWGLTSGNSKDGQLFGRFFYDRSGPRVQYFDVEGGSQSYLFIELKIHSNHGNLRFTCVYRLRVHGTLDASKSNHAGKQ